MVVLPSASRMLELCENGAREHAIDRALTILCAFTGESRETLASLGVHRRDALLLQSRILAFGSAICGSAPCEACGCDVEVEFEVTAPLLDALPESGSVDAGGRSIRYRVPNSYDLAEAVAYGDPQDGAAVLRSRCISADEPLDEDAFHLAGEALEALSEPATIALASRCPSCDARFAPAVDIASFLWSELSIYAQSLLDDVDALASRYAWSEYDILALPDARRRRYVEGIW